MTTQITSLYTNLKLYTTNERFYIEPEGGNEVLVIDRLADTVHHEINTGQARENDATSQQIFGLVGVINLIAGPYLIVISQIGRVGELNGQVIYRIEDVEILSFKKTTTHLTEEQITFNTSYLNMVKTVFNTPSFYFSYTYHLSHTLQRLHLAGPDFKKLSPIEGADNRFVWNLALLSRFASPEFHRYCLPIIHGFISINNMQVNSQRFSITLISRRSVQRAGTRLFMRGADSNGFVANFVETEQIVELRNLISSFVQIRGSIPLVWNQFPNIKYKPNPKLSQNHNQEDIFIRHVDQIYQNYGRIVMLNLINTKGEEKVLGDQLTQIISQATFPHLKYEWFDFHHECSKNRWHRLSKLINQISSEQREQGLFCMLIDGTVLSLQNGVFRTNCIDSLDRTNVVQNLIAKITLEQVLIKNGLFDAGDKIENYPHIENVYRNVWADNADYCSIQYAGTGALKTDYTRTGKRTQIGLLRDGINSLIRYYKNNFADGFRQDAIDLVLGHYNVSESEGKSTKCPLDEKKGWRYMAIPSILLGSLSMFFLTFFVPSEFTSEHYCYLLFWGSMLSSAIFFVFLYGTEFVDSPKLKSKAIKSRTNSWS